MTKPAGREIMGRGIRNLYLFSLIMCLLALCISPVCADEVKKLYFEQKNGKMVWNNIRGDDGNWFMSFTNMIPGGQYADRLDIENGSDKTYALYMQVLPIQQDQKRDELLELISMKVKLSSKVLYDGTASGKEYDHGNLRNAIYLGTYKPGGTDQISVELELNKNVRIEYCDLLTKNDWKFMVTEIQNPKNPGSGGSQNPPQTIHPPKTGDTSESVRYMMILLVALAVVLLLAERRDARKRR